MNSMVPLQDLGCLDPLPGRGELDQDALLGHAELLVQGDQLQGLGHLALHVEAEPSVHLSGDAALHNLQDLSPETDKQFVHGDLDLEYRHYDLGLAKDC